ncbi:hypothetical protein BASA81_008452 [Batrachochytrium salamandrivorans]|nr:hypothetical protein BASA81_008452 [Batrachochytrium salamandrivorans]
MHKSPGSEPPSAPKRKQFATGRGGGEGEEEDEEEPPKRSPLSCLPIRRKSSSSSSGGSPPAADDEDDESFDFAELTRHISTPLASTKVRSSSLGFSTFSHASSAQAISRPHRQSFPVLGQDRRDSLLGASRFASFQPAEQDTGSEDEDDSAHLPAPILFTEQIHTKARSSSTTNRRPKPLPTSEKARKSILGSIRERRRVQERVHQDCAVTRHKPSGSIDNLVEGGGSGNGSGNGEEEDDQAAVIRLDRGGVLVKTSLGLIQFGIPPETIKDVLQLGLEVPQHYVVPRDRFDNLVGLNMCELEFPGYYQFFLKQRSMTVIVPNEDTEHALRRLMHEILQGPPEQHLYTEEECLVDPESRPDHVKEMAFFVRPRNGRSIDVDSLFTFQRFEPLEQHLAMEDGREDVVVAQVQLNEQVTLLETTREWIVLDGGREVSRIEFWWASLVPQHATIATPLPERNFVPPKLGVTVLGSSHGFDAKQNTSGFVLWIHGKGIMVDPPPFCTGDILKRAGISPRWISAIILTHCHADHDAGTFQKILVEGRVTLMTTKTIMASFLRKYSKISGYTEAFLCRLFEPRIVRIGEDVFYAGGRIKFHYSFHALPCIGFQAFVNGKSVAYSADTLYEPKMLNDLCHEGVLSKGRMQSLLSFPFETADLVLHEAGIPPIHTPVSVLQSLSPNAQSRLYLIHIAEQVAEKSGLRLARVGAEHTIRVVDDDRNSLSFVLDVLTHSELFFPHLASANRYGRALVLAAQEKVSLYDQPQVGDFAFLDHAKNSHGARYHVKHRYVTEHTQQPQQQQRLSNLSQGSKAGLLPRAAAAAAASGGTPRLKYQTSAMTASAAVAMFADEADDDFTVPQVADLLRMSATRVKPANVVVSAAQGEGDVGLYLILKGFCKIQRRFPPTLHDPELAQPCEGPVGSVLEPGDCFGILSVGDNCDNGLFRTSEVITMTEVELLEVDLSSLGYMLSTYPALDGRLTRMHDLRMLSAWKTMELNSCLQRLVSFQRTQLLSILEKKEFAAGEELWTKRQGPRNAYLIVDGQLMFPEMAENDHPFTAGAFLCDFHSMIERRKLSSNGTVGGGNGGSGDLLDEEKNSIASDEHSQISLDLNPFAPIPPSPGSGNPSLVAKTKCTVFEIAWKDAVQFLESNPGVLVQVFHSCATE